MDNKKIIWVLVILVLLITISFTLDFFVKNGMRHCNHILVGGRECNIIQSYLHDHIGLNLTLALFLGTIQLLFLFIALSQLPTTHSEGRKNE